MVSPVSEYRRQSIACGHLDRFGPSASVDVTLFTDVGDDLYIQDEAGLITAPARRSSRSGSSYRMTPGQRNKFYRDVMIHAGFEGGMLQREIWLALGLCRRRVQKILSAPPEPAKWREVDYPPRKADGLDPAVSAARDRLLRHGQRRGMSERQLAMATGLVPSHVHKILNGRPK